MLETSWLWFVISKEYVELTRPKIESRDPIFFTGTRSRSRVSGNDRLFPCGSEFGPNLEIPAGPAIQLRPGPAYGTPNILPPRTPDIIAHWQVAPPARPPSRWLPHMILTEPCCSFPNIPNMGWHNKNIFWYNINKTNVHAWEPDLSKIKHRIIL